MAETALTEQRCIAVALLLLTVAGCATQKGVGLPEFDDWNSRRDALSSVSEWEFHGRIGVSAGDEGFNGKLRWWQHDDVFVASVSGPLGVGTVKIQGDERQEAVTMRTAKSRKCRTRRLSFTGGMAGLSR